jgi:iron(III) transport system ATP-binding protein
VAGVTLDRVTRRFGRTAAVDGVSLEVADGAFLALLGPSGCGKTTLLRLVAGFEAPDEGRVAIGGRTVAGAGAAIVPPEERGLGMVFQSYALWPHMTVAANVGYALKVRGLPRAERTRRIAAALAEVGLEARAAARPAELSGGQRQRVALARVFAAAPGLVLLDEPLANLDPHLREEMQSAFRRMHRRLGATMLYVTHDQEEAMALADRVAVMDRGRLQQVAPPETLYREPATPMVAAFVGRGMVVPATVRGAGAHGLTADLWGTPVEARAGRAHASGSPAALCLRAEALRLGAPGDGLPARVDHVVFRGDRRIVTVRPVAAPEHALRVDHRGPAPGEGDAVAVLIADAWAIPGA